MSEPITVTLPWMDKALSPNSRKRWDKISAAKDARQLASLTVMTEWIILGPAFDPDYPLKISFIFHPPTCRYYDLDGLVTRCKNYQDGICDAIHNNDNQIIHLEARKKDVVKGGSVTITISEDDE